MAFLKPTGPNPIGTVVARLVDGDRAAFLDSQSSGRHITVKIWYPSTSDATDSPELLWQEVRSDPRTPWPMRLFLTCLRVRTSAVPHARVRSGLTTSAVVIYNHGLVSFPSENTSLMEELASHGFVILSVAHAEQYSELQALNRGQTSDQRHDHQKLMKRLSAAPTRGKAGIAPDLYRNAANTNRIVDERATDTSFVLDNLSEVIGQIPGLPAEAFRSPAIHCVGYSVGGAVSNQVALRDNRCVSVANLDGGMYGFGEASDIGKPYLMIYSSDNVGINDRLLPPNADVFTLPSSRHLNLHDVAMVLPGLRLIKATGATNPRKLIAQRNEAVLDFLTR